jgi:Flp pilus assembly protein TadG
LNDEGSGMKSNTPAQRAVQLQTSALERGQAYVEFVLVLPLFLIVIAGVVGFGQLLYTKLALEAAAWSGARHAVATLDQARGVNQAYQGARYALDGFGLNPDHAAAQVSVWGAWGRGTQVRARVCYAVPAPPVPFGQILAPQQVCASQTLPVYRWKSKW